MKFVLLRRERHHSVGKQGVLAADRKKTASAEEFVRLQKIIVTHTMQLYVAFCYSL
jgi:hypothetical protein